LREKEAALLAIEQLHGGPAGEVIRRCSQQPAAI
jgi:hypothetical protein